MASAVAGIDIFVEVAFGSDPFATPTWTDITDDVYTISTSRGRNYELDRMDAGTATFELDNTSGYYYSHNTESPYYPNVRPMVPIRVRAVYATVDYPIWYGYVERWPGVHPGNIDAIVTVDAVDLFKSLSLADASLQDRNALVTALAPVAWWRFNDDTDSSVAGTHDLTLSGALTGQTGAWTEDEAGTFDGVNDFATVANEVDIELRSDMTIEMWFKPEFTSAPVVETFNSDNTWICPAGVTSVTAECWAGGGGGEAGTSGGGGGGGGGGGAYARKTVSVIPGNSYTIDVGPGGTGGSSTGANGSNGASTSFDSPSVVARFGVGGGSGGNGVGGTGGALSLSTGTTRHSGGDGGTQQFVAAGFASGGGGSGSFTINGGDGVGGGFSAGAGGTAGAGGGAGGNGGNFGPNPPTAGAAGTAPGGGGGGGGNDSDQFANGGAGAAGRVKLTYQLVESQVVFSCRGTDVLYQLTWNGYKLTFTPGNGVSTALDIGDCAGGEWHHVVVSIDWTSGRTIRGWLNGSITFSTTVGYQPPVQARIVNIGRRATANDLYFDGSISELVIYNTLLTTPDVTALYAAQLEGFATQPTGDRIEYILGTAEVGVGTAITTVDLDTGQTIISGPNSPTDVTALEAIQLAADTEFGQFFIGADGIPVFHDRYHRLTAATITTFDQTDYETINTLGKDDAKVLNDVRIAPSDTDPPAIAVDADSRTHYGKRTYERTIYPDDVNVAADYANFLLALYKEPKDDIYDIPFRLYSEVSPIALLLAAELDDRYHVTVPLTGDDLDMDVYLEKISHTIDNNLSQWHMTWVVSPAGATEDTTFWLLATADAGELDVTTRLGF